MREPIRYLSENATLPLPVIPNAGLPLNTGVGESVYPLEPQPMAAALTSGDYLCLATTCDWRLDLLEARDFLGKYTLCKAGSFVFLRVGQLTRQKYYLRWIEFG